MDEDFRFKICAIPPGSFVVFRVTRPDRFPRFDRETAREWREKKLGGGLILTMDEHVETWTDEQLRKVGLMRIPKS